MDSTNIEIKTIPWNSLGLSMLLCLGPLRTQQSFNKLGLVKLNFAAHKNTGNFASLTKRARSTSLLLISSVNILLRSKKRKKKPETGDFHVSKLLFLRVQIFFVHLFALRYQISWINCFTKFGYMMSQVLPIRCHVLSWFAQRVHNDNTSMVQIFPFPLSFWDQPKILVWSHQQASGNDKEKRDCVA